MAYTTIDDPSAHFQTAIYSGTGNGQQVTNDGNSNLQPDWIWAKRRDDLGYHQLIDSSRGGTKRLWSNDNGAEGTQNNVASFDSDGFTAGDSSDITPSSTTMVAWQWKANGGTTTTNDSSSTGVGNVDSIYQANTTAGFSIVTFPSDNTAGRTVAHGLGAAPTFIITKGRAQTSSWYTYHKEAGANKWLTLNSTNAAATNTGIWGNTHPTSSIFTIGNNETGYNNGGDNDSIAYCFAPIQGYSKFGSYTGNGTSSSADFDGPFVYTGFKPAWIMTKRSSSSGGSWAIVDNKRDTINPTQIALFANTNGADDTDKKVDFLSNGFKLRNSRDDFNTDGVTYIYMAFAEHPFVSSEGVPTTAR